MQKNQLYQEANMSTATNQAVNGRDENGRFAIGNKPTVGLNQIGRASCRERV